MILDLGTSFYQTPTFWVDSMGTILNYYEPPQARFVCQLIGDTLARQIIILTRMHDGAEREMNVRPQAEPGRGRYAGL